MRLNHEALKVEINHLQESKLQVIVVNMRKQFKLKLGSLLVVYVYGIFEFKNTAVV